MKKRFHTLLVSIQEENLTEQERFWYRRMLQTLRAVDVFVVDITEKKVVYETGVAAIALVDTEEAKERIRALHLPVVYYSHQCIGGYGADMLLMSFAEIGYDFFQQIFDRFHGQPWTILETRRCVLREAVLSDLDTFYEIYAQPSVARFMEPLSDNYQEEQDKLASYIKNQYPFYGFGTWTVLAADYHCLDEDGSAPQQSSDSIIGRAGLNINEKTGNIQLGYVIREEYQGQGIATEVCQAILNYARKELELSRIELEVDPDNVKSLKLAKKLGFLPVETGSMCCIFNKDLL